MSVGIEASPVGNALIALMADRIEWTGKPTELFNALTDIAGDRQVRSKSWPQSLKGLNNSIKRLTPGFRSIGIEITKQHFGDRKYSIIKDLIYPPKAPYAPEVTTDKACKDGGYKSQAPDTAVKRPTVAVGDSKRLLCTLDTTRVVAVTADMAVKSDDIINTNDEAVF